MCGLQYVGLNGLNGLNAVASSKTHESSAFAC